MNSLADDYLTDLDTLNSDFLGKLVVSMTGEGYKTILCQKDVDISNNCIERIYQALV